MEEAKQKQIYELHMKIQLQDRAVQESMEARFN